MRNQALEEQHHTRMIVMGEAALADGLKLIGFETWIEPTVETMEQVLNELVEDRWKAFVILGRTLSREESPILKQLRSEGGRIVLTKVPPLNDPSRFHCDIDDQIQTLMGGGDLMGRES
jgi:vacuolar-type H+-ATPase subunit F/Vma7